MRPRRVLRARIVGLSAAITGMVFAGCAPALAAGWSAPVAVPDGSGPQVWPGDLTLGFDGTGRGVITWLYGTRTLAMATAVLGPGGSWQRGPDAPPGELGVSAQYGRDRVMTLVGREALEIGGPGVFVRSGRFGGFPGAPTRIGSSAPSDLAIAANRDGAAVAVAATGRSGPSVVEAATRPVRGAFGTMQRIASTWSRFPAAAVDEHGTAIVVWWRKYGPQGRRRVEGRLHRPHGGWGPVEHIADLPPTEPRLTVAAAHGTFLVGWSSRDISSGGEDEGTLTGGAVRRSAGHWRAQLLRRTSSGGWDSGPYLSADLTGIRAFVDLRGRGTLIWVDRSGAQARVVATRAAATGFAAPIGLTGGVGGAQALADAALRGDGRIAVATIGIAAGATQPGLDVTVLPPGATTPSSTVLSPPDEPVRSARVAFVPSTPALTALWAARPDDGPDTTLWTASTP